MEIVFDNANNLRIIKTARNRESINNAANQGFWPLVKIVVPSNEIKKMFAVLQNPDTGEINVINDFRAIDPTMVKAIPFISHYPYHHESPYSAYLIPDIDVGERVWIEDVIEDRVFGRSNQGDNYRLLSVEAIWNGSDMEIQYQERTGYTVYY